MSQLHPWSLLEPSAGGVHSPLAEHSAPGLQSAMLAQRVLQAEPSQT